MPGAEVAQNLLQHLWVINCRDHAPGAPADGVVRRIEVPNPQEQVPPSLWGCKRRWRRGWRFFTCDRDNL